MRAAIRSPHALLPKLSTDFGTAYANQDIGRDRSLRWLASALRVTKNRGMPVTPDVIGALISIIGAAAIIFGGQFALMNRLESRLTTHMNLRFDHVDKRFDQVDKRFEQVDKQFEQVDKQFEQVDKQFEQVNQQFAQVHQQFAQVHQQLDAVKADIVTLKVSVARLEGPPPRLISVR